MVSSISQKFAFTIRFLITNLILIRFRANPVGSESRSGRFFPLKASTLILCGLPIRSRTETLKLDVHLAAAFKHSKLAKNFVGKEQSK